MMMDSKYSQCAMQYYKPCPIVNIRLAHAYVPFERLECIYPPITGLERGTIFPELDRPYGADAEYTVDA